MEKKKLEKIENLLDRLNIPVDILGYQFLVSALEVYTENINTKIRAVYEIVAKKHNKTACAVEKAIRHAIEKNKDTIKQYFHVNYAITNRRFLALLAREIGR